MTVTYCDACGKATDTTRIGLTTAAAKREYDACRPCQDKLNNILLHTEWKTPEGK